MIDVVPNAGVIALGKQGENRAVRVTLPNIRAGAGSILLLHQRSDDQKPYPVSVVEADGGIIWTVSSTDTAYPGRGQAELQWLGENGAVAKSITYQTNTTRSMAEPGSVPDEPLKPYTQAVARDAQAAKDAAASAAESAQSAAASAGQAGLSAENAAKSLKQLTDGIASGDFRGQDGKSAYQLAVDAGFDGTETQWLESLKGAPGDTTDADAAAEAAKKAAQEAQKAAEDCTGKLSGLKEDLDKLDESVKKKIEPNRTTFFDYVESTNLFNVQNTVVNSDGLTITIKDGNIKCEGVYSLSYNKSIDTGATISLQTGEYDVSAWNGSGEFDVDLVSGSETKRVNCNGAYHTTIKLTFDATYSIKVRCTPSFSSGSCDIMIVKGLSKPLAYEKWFESNASVKKSVLPVYQKFYGKRIVTIGDSIMHGDGNDYYGIGDILAERNGMKLSDYSEGGATISFRQDKASASDEWSKGQNIQYQATKMLANETEKPCIVLIDGQTNDINYVSGSEKPQQALGTITTSYTSFSSNENFCGGLEKIFSDIKKVWTDVPIIYIRAHKMMSRKVEWQESYGEKAIQICKKWSVKVVDIYSEGGLNTLIKEHKIYTGNNGDYTHPNREGYDLFYIPMIENAMMNIIS
nr:MAG TPA: GDSL like Lipase Acylhydrolase [Caudoviricetes sp.]